MFSEHSFWNLSYKINESRILLKTAWWLSPQTPSHPSGLSFLVSFPFEITIPNPHPPPVFQFYSWAEMKNPNFMESMFKGTKYETVFFSANDIIAESCYLDILSWQITTLPFPPGIFLHIYLPRKKNCGIMGIKSLEPHTCNTSDLLLSHIPRLMWYFNRNKGEKF